MFCSYQKFLNSLLMPLNQKNETYDKIKKNTKVLKP